MARKTGAAQAPTAVPPKRHEFTLRTYDADSATKIRRARRLTGWSHSQIIEWCVQHAIDRFLATHDEADDQTSIRGRRPKLAP